jgi:transposase
MCLHSEEIPSVPEQTACVAKAAFPKGNLYMRREQRDFVR